MKNFINLITCLLVLLAGRCLMSAQTYLYPFQDVSLPAEERIDNLLSLMTLEEKIATFSGQGVPRLGVPSPGSSEAIHGLVRGGATDLEGFVRMSRLAETELRPEEKRTDLVHSTAFPQGYGLGETWDREILRMVGEAMSVEARYHSWKNGRNVLCLWAPNADLGRDPRWGRTEECFGEDPFLVGELVAAEVRGIQGDDPQYWRSAAVMKHFLANSNEDGRCFTSSDFDEALFRDYYSYGFWKGVRDGGARSLMCAYNKYNGVPCSVSDFIQEILVDEWGMDGQILNDGGALKQLVTMHHYADDVKQAVKMSVEAGITRILDQVSEEMAQAVAEGLLSEEIIDRNVRFNIRTMLRLGLMDSSERNPYRDMGFTDVAPWETAEHKDLARQVTRKSVVLLKNEGGLLPLDKKEVRKIAVIGNRAESVLKDWYGALPAYSVSALEGIKAAVEDEDVEVRFQAWDSDGKAQELAAWADVAIVCVGNHPMTSPDWKWEKIQAPWGEGTVAGDGREAVDRRSLELETEDLIKVVWKANPNTIVALISSFPYTIDWTQEHVPSILHVSQCSQELGNALADVIFGDYNPAGRTTQTWVKDILDLPGMLDYDIRNGRTYMYFKGEPLYPFGYGLSYTSFEYSRLKVRCQKDSVRLSFDLSNTGGRDGEEVVQLYVRFPGDDAAMRLRGFERVPVSEGETVRVDLVVPFEDLKLWDTEAGAFGLAGGRYEFLIGASSEDIRLSYSVAL